MNNNGETTNLTEEDSVALSSVYSILYRGFAANLNAFREALLITEEQKKIYKNIMTEEKNDFMDEYQTILRQSPPERKNYLIDIFERTFIINS
jgi:superfamily I DNA and RNA helicase